MSFDNASRQYNDPLLTYSLRFGILHQLCPRYKTGSRSWKIFELLGRNAVEMFRKLIKQSPNPIIPFILRSFARIILEVQR